MDALGMVKHLAATTRFRTRHVFEGAEVDFSRPGSAELEWKLTESDTSAGIIDFNLGEHRHAVKITLQSPPETLAQRDFGSGVKPTLAWIALHLLQESARHCGHLDITRVVRRRR